MKTVLLRLLQGAVSGGILWLVYRQVPLEAVLSAGREIRVELLAAAVCGNMAMHGLVARRLQFLMAHQGHVVTVRRMFALHVGSLCYKLFLPGGTLASFLARFYKMQIVGGRASALSAVMVDRWLATIGLCLVGGACWGANRGAVPAPLSMVFVLSVGTVGAVVAGLWWLHAAGVGGRLIRSIPFAPVRERAERVSAALDAFRRLSPGQWAWGVCLAVGPHALGVAVFAWLGAGMGVSLPLLTWGWIRALVLLASMAPVSLAGLGVRDVTLLYVLAFFGVSEDRSLAVASAIFVVTVVLVAVVGGVIEAFWGLRMSRTR